jgi:hypothetical protein
LKRVVVVAVNQSINQVKPGSAAPPLCEDTPPDNPRRRRTGPVSPGSKRRNTRIPCNLCHTITTPPNSLAKPPAAPRLRLLALLVNKRPRDWRGEETPFVFSQCVATSLLGTSLLQLTQLPPPGTPCRDGISGCEGTGPGTSEQTDKRQSTSSESSAAGAEASEEQLDDGRMRAPSARRTARRCSRPPVTLRRRSTFSWNSIVRHLSKQ